MKNDNNSLIRAMKYNIEQKQIYIRVLEEELYQLKRVIGDGKQKIKERREKLTDFHLKVLKDEANLGI